MLPERRHAPWAGAIFTEEEMQFILVVVVLVLLVGLVLVGFFARSCVRLLTQDEKSSKDIAIVAVGAMLMLPTIVSSVWSAAWAPIESRNRQDDQAVVMQLIEEVTGRSEADFQVGVWHDFQECWLYKVDLLPSAFDMEDLDPELAPVRDMIIRDAELFEAAGWEIEKFGPDDSVRGETAGIAFRADFGEHALQLYDWGGLGYAYLESDCSVGVGNIRTWREAVDEFPSEVG